MIFSAADFNFKKIINYVDWKLLLFLLLFLDVKLAIKIPAIIIIYLLQFNFKLGFSLKNSRLPLFYLAVVTIAFANLLITGSYREPGYLLAFFTGIGFWALCILAIHQIKLCIENNNAETIHHTIVVFFALNAVFSFYNIAHIMWDTGSINPYRYQGEYQKYFIGTGDFIKGVTFDSSTTNAVLNAFGVIYFLTRKNPVFALICMIVLLLTGSNFINLALVIVLVLLFAFKSSRDQKSLIAICLALLVVFMAKISPENNQYVIETIKNTFHTKPPAFLNTMVVDKKPVNEANPEEIKRNYAKNYLDSLGAIETRKRAQPVTSKAVINLPKTGAGRIFIKSPKCTLPVFQASTATTPEQKKLLSFIDSHKTRLPASGEGNFNTHLPGKAIAFIQTLNFMRLHPAKLIAGDGMGNFSSKLSFRATGLGFSGSYPTGRSYISGEFLSNHLDVYLKFFSRRSDSHSLINSPNSVYDQLLVEYGLLGLFAFGMYYVWFFLKHYKRLTYGVPLLLLLLGIFFIDYWFEQLSVIVFFELLLFLDIKQTANKIPVSYAYQ